MWGGGTMKSKSNKWLSIAPEDPPVNKIHVTNLYDAPALCGVYTIEEVVAIWKRSRRQVMYAMENRLLKFRLATHGGLYMIDRASIVALWGQPVGRDLVQECFEGEILNVKKEGQEHDS